MKKTIAGILVLMMIFTFALSTVGAFVPPGLAKKGGLPPGIQKRFGVEEQLTDKKILDGKYETVVKEIDLDKRRITIQEGEAIISLLVANRAEIKLDDKEAALKDIKKGYKVYLELDKDNVITKIIGKTGNVVEEKTKSIKGAMIYSINERDQKIALSYDSKRETYYVDRSTVIEIKGNKKTLGDLSVDMKVDVTVKEETIVKLTVVNETTRHEGVLLGVFEDKDGPYIILDKNGTHSIFDVKEGLDIPDSYSGREVYVEVKNGFVTDIWRK